MKTIYLITTNCGDGSNGLLVVRNQEVLAKMREQAEEGNEYYASGDGLQVHALKFPLEFDVDAWVAQNFYGGYTEEVEEY